MAELFGCPFKGWGAGGVTSHRPKCKLKYGDVPPKWVDFTHKKKSVNMGLISTPKKIPKRGLNL